MRGTVRQVPQRGGHRGRGSSGEGRAGGLGNPTGRGADRRHAGGSPAAQATGQPTCPPRQRPTAHPRRRSRRGRSAQTAPPARSQSTRRWSPGRALQCGSSPFAGWPPAGGARGSSKESTCAQQAGGSRYAAEATTCCLPDCGPGRADAPTPNPQRAWLAEPSRAAARPKKVCMPVAYTTQWRSPCLIVEPAGGGGGGAGGAGALSAGGARWAALLRMRMHMHKQLAHLGAGTQGWTASYNRRRSRVCAQARGRQRAAQRAGQRAAGCAAARTGEGDVAGELLDWQGLAGEGSLVALQNGCRDAPGA